MSVRVYDVACGCSRISTDDQPEALNTTAPFAIVATEVHPKYIENGTYNTSNRIMCGLWENKIISIYDVHACFHMRMYTQCTQTHAANDK